LDFFIIIYFFFSAAQTAVHSPLVERGLQFRGERAEGNELSMTLRGHTAQKREMRDLDRSSMFAIEHLTIKKIDQSRFAGTIEEPTP
jgi:hypothetical protein